VGGKTDSCLHLTVAYWKICALLPCTSAAHTNTTDIPFGVLQDPIQFLDNVQDKCSTADDFWETGFNRPMDQQSIYEERIRLGLRNPRKKERKNEAPIKIHNGISTNLVVIASLT